MTLPADARKLSAIYTFMKYGSFVEFRSIRERPAESRVCIHECRNNCLLFLAAADSEITIEDYEGY